MPEETVSVPAVQPVFVLPAVNDRCIVVYDGFKYFGKVEAVDAKTEDVSVMKCVKGNRFRFPKHVDVCWYNRDSVI